MLDFGTTFVSWLGATAIPAIVGLFVVVGARKFAGPRYLAAFALGIFLWFFVDTIGGAANLDVGAGLGGGIDQAAIIALFAIGLVVVLALGGDLFGDEYSVKKYGITIPLLVAAAVGIHGFGEGTAFGATASTTTSGSLIDAFGGVTSGVAYALHKGFEPMMIGAAYAVYSWDPAKHFAGRVKDVLLLAVVFVVPSMLGAVSGYFINYDATYFFALGTGTSVYAALRLAKPLFQLGQAAGQRESIKIAISIVVGLLAIYGAALLHS